MAEGGAREREGREHASINEHTLTHTDTHRHTQTHLHTETRTDTRDTGDTGCDHDGGRGGEEVEGAWRGRAKMVFGDPRIVAMHPSCDT